MCRWWTWNVLLRDLDKYRNIGEENAQPAFTPRRSSSGLLRAALPSALTDELLLDLALKLPLGRWSPEVDLQDVNREEQRPEDQHRRDPRTPVAGLPLVAQPLWPAACLPVIDQHPHPAEHDRADGKGSDVQLQVPDALDLLERERTRVARVGGAGSRWGLGLDSLVPREQITEHGAPPSWHGMGRRRRTGRRRPPSPRG